MSYTKDITIWCDEPECMRWTQGNATTKSVQLARRHIRATGWTYTVAFGDRCPPHSQETT